MLHRLWLIFWLLRLVRPVVCSFPARGTTDDDSDDLILSAYVRDAFTITQPNLIYLDFRAGPISCAFAKIVHELGILQWTDKKSWGWVWGGFDEEKGKQRSIASLVSFNELHED